MAKKKKAKSAKSKKFDQLYVSKSEIDAKDKTWLKGAIKANKLEEAKVSKAFEATITKHFGVKFWKRLTKTAQRRQMFPRQYANAILVKPTGRK